MANSTDSEKDAGNGALWLLAGVGTQLSASVIAGFGLGFATDVFFETKPIFMMAFGLLGFVGGLMRVYQLLSKVS